MRAKTPAALLLVAAAMLALTGTGLAQRPVTGDAPRLAPILESVSGRDTYNFYCVGCHGPTGRGGGPVAPTLKTKVPDLTTLARRNGGAFPLDQQLRQSAAQLMIVARDLQGTGVFAARGGNEITVGKLIKSDREPRLKCRTNWVDRLAGKDEHVESHARYGRAGQTQHGIDMLRDGKTAPRSSFDRPSAALSSARRAIGLLRC